VDESGTVGASKGSHFLVVAVLSASQPRDIELPVRRALKKYGRSLSAGEIKAARTEEAAILRMLQTIAEQDVRVVAVIVDQKAISRPPKDSEEIYRPPIRWHGHFFKSMNEAIPAFTTSLPRKCLKKS